jgi:hypothetical protein
MSTPRQVAAALIAATLLLAGTGCTSSTPDPQGSTMNTNKAQMPDLPEDPAAAEAAVRKMMMDQAIILLKASGLKHSAAQFNVPAAFDDDKAQSGELTIQFQPCTDAQEQAMTNAIWANGWEKGSISHGVNVRKGPLYLLWGIGKRGCRFDMTTVNIDHYLPGIKDTTNVPELADYKAAG